MYYRFMFVIYMFLQKIYYTYNPILIIVWSPLIIVALHVRITRYYYSCYYNYNIC